ncbi:MAG TPA: hypothetical protein ENN05_10630 [Deltaproteobacteria bacterium]|nr:hypothetical protein [Deltaproteobacteria bacterium]
MKKCAGNLFAAIVLALALLASTALTGCEGSDARKSIDDAVEEVSGAKIINKGENIKKQIQDLNAQDIERIQKDIEKGVYSEED